jgi:phosphatidylglycerol---prolipoprotein diacylglyceryl transferase
MLEAFTLLSINIGIDPEIAKIGGLLLTWHGVFTAVGIAAAVYLAVVLGKKKGFLEDDIYTVALLAIPCGIVGARALFVVERWGDPGVKTVWDAFRINEGGISIYGAVLGGIAGGAVYCFFRKLPMRRGADVAGCAALLGMAIGRIGDLINGEHFSRVSSLPWAVRYTNSNSPSYLAHPQCGIDPNLRQFASDLCAQHPAVVYEMIGDLLILGICLFIMFRIRRDGVAFFTFLFLYSAMRFGVTALRIDSRVIIWGLRTPQVTALFLMPPALLGLIYSWRKSRSDEPVRPPPEVAPARPSRATAR